jgi:hypothetical protein
VSDSKYLLRLTPSEANSLLYTRLKRSTEQLMKIYHDDALDTPESLDAVITQLQELKACVELLDTWKKETLTKLNSKETTK